MNAHISFKGNGPTGENSYRLNNLAALIEQDTDLSVQSEKAPPKEGDKALLTIALSIAGLALSAVATLVSVLSYWKSQQPRCSVTLTYGDITIELDNIPPDQLQTMIAKLEEQKHSSTSDLTILLAEE